MYLQCLEGRLMRVFELCQLVLQCFQLCHLVLPFSFDFCQLRRSHERNKSDVDPVARLLMLTDASTSHTVGAVQGAPHLPLQFSHLQLGFCLDVIEPLQRKGR